MIRSPSGRTHFVITVGKVVGIPRRGLTRHPGEMTEAGMRKVTRMMRIHVMFAPSIGGEIVRKTMRRSRQEGSLAVVVVICIVKIVMIIGWIW